jgi:hypothetical protein
MLIKSNKGNYCIPPLRNSINDQHIDNIAYDDSDKCELLNKYFSSISKLDEENVTLPQFDSKTNNIIHEIHITENEIIDVIQILDPNKATEPDKISHKMLKIFPEKIAKPPLIIFNKSLQHLENILLIGRVLMLLQFSKRVTHPYPPIIARYL